MNQQAAGRSFRLRDLLIVVPLLFFGAAFFVAGIIIGGFVVLTLIATLLWFAFWRVPRPTESASQEEQAEMALRWQYPGNSGGGGAGC